MSRFFFVVLLAGCGDEPASTRVPLDEQADADLLPDGATGNGIRPRRRMDLDQLSAAISRVTDGLGWIRWWDGRDYYDVYAQTLGQPNYTDLTAEDLSPSLLFQKFLDDGSRQVCDQLVAREVAGGEKILTANPDVRENLSALLLRFHGRVVPADSRQIDPWQRVYDTSTATTGDPMTGWRAVCVGLFVHPDFYSY
jgi:hypothetical protein